MRLLSFVLAVITAFTVIGSTPADSVKVYFRVGHRQFDPSLGDNRANMQRFVAQVREANAAGDIENIVVRAYASPDGMNRANQRLSVSRCQVIADYIATHTGVNPEIIKTYPGGIAWDELRQLVAANPDVPSQEKIIDILDNTPVWVFNSDGKIIDSRKKQLMDFGQGIPYRWMLTNLFPELRNAVAVLLFVTTKSGSNATQGAQNAQSNLTGHTGLLGQNTDQSANTADSANNGVDAKTASSRQSAQDGQSKLTDSTAQSGQNNALSAKAADSANNGVDAKTASSDQSRNHNASGNLSASAQMPTGSKPFYFALKTNMLYDAMLVPNIGAEFYLGKNLSLYGEWMHAWWSYNNRHRYYRIYGGDLGLRWWFGKKANHKPLTGHHIGAYAGAFTFDMEFGNRGYMGGLPGGNLFDRCFINAGLEYGYSLPVSRHLNIDFSIGFGYISGKYMEYIPDGFEHGYLWQQTKRFGWFGPTKAEVSLVWLLGRGNVNARKGGDR